MKPYTKIITILAVVVLVAMAACFLPQNAAYAQVNTVTLIADSGEPPFWVVEADQNGLFTIPDATPSKEGHTFKAWSDSFATYEAGKTYTIGETDDINLNLYAVWEPIVEQNKPKPLFNSGEKIALYISLGVLAVIFVFSYYWFGIKERSLKQLGARIGGIFVRKRKRK